MARNPLKGEVALVLSDGREFTLALDMEAMLTVEEATGKPLAKVMAMAGEGFLSASAAIALAAFQRHHPEITRADVLEMIRTDPEAVSAALEQASAAAFPEDKPGNAKAPKAARPRGKSSGRSGAKRG
ncbi:hypothetical protein K3172_12920 [Qipengyuania sp. 6B39]|uniref:hypothetical protein n=1 Tax=Qipengyuania proteolytica TaxID=2867239 RepID=UPI001C89D7C1|nr:hypothetical protein [Qipengyuania proteolytica]MBX7496761.1 hypothetical protein [Qipengyuania proteolytica]